MTQENLRELLGQLHTHLGQAKSLDAESRRLLTTLSHDIEQALGRASEETAPAWHRENGGNYRNQRVRADTTRTRHNVDNRKRQRGAADVSYVARAPDSA